MEFNCIQVYKAIQKELITMLMINVEKLPVKDIRISSFKWNDFASKWFNFHWIMQHLYMKWECQKRSLLVCVQIFCPW